jgi:hypothetical protein
MGYAALDAVQLLAEMAEAGRHPQEVAAHADRIAVGWYLEAGGCAAPERLALLVQELRRWCLVASGHYAHRWDVMHRAGYPEEAEEARRWAEALDQAHRALRLYD